MISLRRSLIAVLSLTLLVSVSAGPALAKCGERFVARPDLTILLAPPPSPGSDADRADFAALLGAQNARTPADEARAVADRPVDAFRVGDVLGADFNRERLPRTAELLDRLDDYVKGPIGAAKDFWCRPRPAASGPDGPLKPLFTARGWSYPSGHNAFGRFAAIVLAQLYPERSAELFARGDRYGDGRVVAGVHFPSDAAAGKLAGVLIAETALSDPSFVFALERAKEEVRVARKALVD